MSEVGEGDKSLQLMSIMAEWQVVYTFYFTINDNEVPR
jgi:hypothetical protein